MRGWMLRPGPRADRYHRGTLTTRPTTKAPGTNRDPRTAAISTYQDQMVRGAVPRTKRWARYTRAHLFRFLGFRQALLSPSKRAISYAVFCWKKKKPSVRYGIQKRSDSNS